MSTKEQTAPVLIVGGGPSGLMMAHELARFDISNMVIDKEITKSPFSRAIAVQIRTLEIFSVLSLYQELAHKSQAVGAIEIVIEGKGPIRIDLPKTTSFFDKALIVDQPDTEAVLEEALLHRGQKVHRGIELVGLAEVDDGIIAKLKHGDGHIEEREFSYVIGADGAHSVVRKSMDNQFLGNSYDDAFILADANCLNQTNTHAFRLFFKKKRFLALIPMHGEHHYRLISVRHGETSKAGLAPTIEEFQDLAKNVMPFPLEITGSSWVSRFFVQCRSAARYQEDGIFLIGDAAHIHSPAGGQGMNTGLQDAFNLAWKLAMTIKGMAKPNILESYHEERKPVGDFLIDHTDRLFKFMVKSSLWARLVRRLVLPKIAQSKKAVGKLSRLLSQTAICYEAGLICKSGEHLTSDGLKLGTRVPNVNLMSNALKKTDLHTLITGLFFSWVFFLPKSVPKKQVAQVLHKMEHLFKEFPKICHAWLVFARDYEAERTVLEADYYVSLNPSPAFDFDEPSYIVTRPDHHVFCLGLFSEIDHAEKSLKRFVS